MAEGENFLEELELIRLSQAGNLDALEQLLSNYEKAIYNLTFRYFGNHHDASDVGQEAMIRIFQKISDFNGKSSFKTWLYRVVTNLCLDELRHRKNKSTSLDEMKEIGYEPTSGFANPEELAENAERNQMIQEILMQLSEEHRTILILKDIEGMEYLEIAQIIGCNMGTVKSRLNRAREAFRKKLINQPKYNNLIERRVQA
ncbi:MAG TPA: sigma-70 family RNA polymerase sigma factor [Bacillota bacterium]|jgi:RNA polymerase sigma-70 factor (ECF subfamily)|nr:sigma-70 family RNA polymerase sigma factor [Bacillota bacterium]HOL09403.1 sigma-70 family RNA polymerase sigma factor [Bacillota bacterium]HPO97127.1 sigma-70 family RNA polymerase sigma factor [Bacillota bacterium]